MLGLPHLVFDSREQSWLRRISGHEAELGDFAGRCWCLFQLPSLLYAERFVWFPVCLLAGLVAVGDSLTRAAQLQGGGGGVAVGARE